MKDELTGSQRHDWAKELYLRDGMSIKDIAAKLGVEQAEVRFWVVRGGWEDQKKATLTSKQTQLGQLYRLLEKVNVKMTEADDINPKDADLAVKYTAAIKNLDEEITIAQIIEVATIFTTWLLRKDRELAQNLTLIFDQFIMQRMQPLGL